MRHCYLYSILAATAAIAVAAAGTAIAAPPPAKFRWQTVVNKNDPMPNSTAIPPRTYNSFNQPSVNARGLVVFRARSRGGPPEGPPTRGIYTRDMSTGGMIRTIAGGDTPVPQPNNILYPPDDLLTTFIEFPSIPRIGIHSDAVVTRGNHQPVWEYGPEGEETRAGTSGVYVNLDGSDPPGELLTAASKLGAVPGFDFFAVPEYDPPKAFDVFPGAPSITDDGIIAFKGNYTDDEGAKTGVFYRELEDAQAGGGAAVELIANSDTEIPNPGDCPDGTTFGSTAPPSAAIDWRGVNRMVFVGLDNEQNPTCGGIYRAPLETEAVLATLIGLGSEVPGEPGAFFNRLGEGLSYDGRFVGFWGAWGEQTRTVRLYCPQEGNRDRIAYCNHTGDFADDGDPDSVCDDETDDTDRCYQEKQVPVNQGMFVHDTRSGWTYRLARTVDNFDDFVYWVYSGRVPGTGEGGEDEGDEDGEAARWRSSAFVAVSSRGAALWAAFKARTGEPDPDTNTYVNPLDGIYLSRKPGSSPLETVVDTLTPGQDLDPEAPPDSLVTELGIERDGFRGRRLVVTARMGEEGGEEEEGMAGIYLTTVP